MEERADVLARYENRTLAPGAYDLFLSHAVADADWAARLAVRFERETWRGRNLRVFTARREIKPGEAIAERIGAAFAQSRKVGAILSPAWDAGGEAECEQLRREASAALREQRLIPLARGETRELPAALREVQALDFRNDDGFERAVALLLALLREEALPQPQAALFPATPEGAAPAEFGFRPPAPIEEARRALQIGGSIEDLIDLAKRLERGNAIGYARRIYEIAAADPQLAAQPERRAFLAERIARATYKDPDLPLRWRLEQAEAILAKAHDLATLAKPEPLGLLGAICKRKWEAAGRKQDLEISLNYYLRGHRAGGIAGDRGYTGINAAFVLDLLAQLPGTPPEAATAHREQARALRRELLAALVPMRQERPAEELGRDYWYLVTIAEACLGMGEYAAAIPWLEAAAGLRDIPSWQFETTARQLGALARMRDAVAVSPEQLAQSPAWTALARFLGGNAAAVRAALLGKVGLALSGGGFRASLFHIGVLARLADLDMLRHVEVLSCVSGGSIIGAHYYLELRRVLQAQPDAEIEPKHYVEIVQKVRENFVKGVQRNLRTRVVAHPWANLKYIFLPAYSRIHRLGELFERHLFRSVDGARGPRWLNELGVHFENDPNFSPKHDNWRRLAKVPILLLNATTLNTGHTWPFTTSWMGEPPEYLDGDLDASERLRRVYYRDAPPAHRRVRLGHAVAASASVPGLFEPLPLAGLYPERKVRLVDGGVFDNQGAAGLLEQNCSVLLVSDASGQMSAQSDPRRGPLDVAMRANTILMARVRQESARDLQNRRASLLLRGLMFLHLKRGLASAPVSWEGCEEPPDKPHAASEAAPAPAVSANEMPKDLRERLAAIRTDLDSFSDVESFTLMTAGYRMAEREFTASVEGYPKPGGFPHAWDFLTIEKTWCDAAQPDSGLLEIVRSRLAAGRHRTLKAWRTSGPLRILTIFFAVVALAFAVFFGGSVFAGLSVVLYTLLEVVVFFGTLVLLPGIIIGTIHSLASRTRWRDSVRKVAAAFFFFVFAMPAAWVHLLVFDRFFLRSLRDLRSRPTYLVVIAAAIFAIGWWAMGTDDYQAYRVRTTAPVNLALTPRHPGQARETLQAFETSTRTWTDIDRFKALLAAETVFSALGDSAASAQRGLAADVASEEIRDPAKRVWAHLELAAREIGSGQFTKALDTAKSIEHPEDKCWALARIFASKPPEIPRSEIFAEAEKVTETIGEKPKQLFALLDLISVARRAPLEVLPKGFSTAALTGRARALVDEIPDKKTRAWARGQFISNLAADTSRSRLAFEELEKLAREGGTAVPDEVLVMLLRAALEGGIHGPDAKAKEIVPRLLVEIKDAGYRAEAELSIAEHGVDAKKWETVLRTAEALPPVVTVPASRRARRRPLQSPGNCARPAPSPPTIAPKPTAFPFTPRSCGRLPIARTDPENSSGIFPSQRDAVTAARHSSEVAAVRAPPAQLIPAWGNAPGFPGKMIQG